MFYLILCDDQLCISSFNRFSSTHPVDEKSLDELDNFQCDQETNGDQVVEQDDEGEEVEAKVSCPAIYEGTNFGQRE